MVVNIWWKVAQGCLFVDDTGYKKQIPETGEII